jgi:hypothetical protein
MVSTLSDRVIQSYSSTDLPTGLTISPSGVLSGTPTVYAATGTFTIIATTGYSTISQVYSYSMTANNILILQTNGTDAITTIFSGVSYLAVDYATDAFVNATFTIGSLTPSGPSISVTSGGVVSGNFTGASSLSYQATLTATYRGVSDSTVLQITFSSYSGAGKGVIFIPAGSLVFSQPTQTTYNLYQYVPYSIPFQVTGTSSFVYYYMTSIPVGFQFVPESTGVSASLSGISPMIIPQTIVVYAKIAAGTPVSIVIQLNTLTPFFVNPQLGAGAYTAILRNEVEANAAQNARDNRTFPQVDALAGPIMAPRAPDVVTALNCFLKLCRKPCPTCKSM